MTDNVKHSTSYFHEVLAKAFEMFKNGYEPVMETPFQPRRQGSAFVVEYKLVRESFDDLANQLMDHMKLAGQPGAKFTGEAVELKDDSGKVIRVPGVVLADKINVQVDSTEIENANQMLDNPPAPNSRLKSILEEGRGVFKNLVENTYDEDLNELAEPKNCGTIFTKEQLDEMHWNELKPLLDEAGIKGRRRQNLIRDFLKKQGEEGES